MRNIFKRFERLENNPRETPQNKELTVSKRFERLEIGDKKIAVLITDKITEAEKTPIDIRHTLLCPYCGMENDSEALNCSFCQHNLKTRLTENYQEQATNLRECECGAMNQKGRAYCWICGKYLGKEEAPQADTENVITLNIDGREYKSNQENLPLDVKILVERIRKNGYSKAIVDEWLKERSKILGMTREMDADRSRDTFYRENRIRQLKFHLFIRGVGIVIFLLFLVFQLSTCYRYFR